MYKKILVATDGSTLAKKAVTHGVDLAQSLGAEVVVVKVVGRYVPSYFEGSDVLANEDGKNVEKHWVSEAKKALETIEKNAAKKGVVAKGVVVRSNDVAEALVAAANKHSCGLIVMASNGRRGLKSILLGSETQHVLASSKIPVLVLR